jgi:glucosamine--fructose-6-phosphate aminotransferase (isomerizing)
MLTEAKEASQKISQLLSRDTALYQELADQLIKQKPNFVATIARGSSDHSATYAQYLFPMVTGRVVDSIPPSVVTVLDSKLDLKNQFVMGISQSGVSPDILRTFEACKKSGAICASIVNDSQSPLARAAQYFFDQHAGVELGLAATKTVLCTLTVIARIAAAWSQDKVLQEGILKLPETLSQNFNLGLGIDPKKLMGSSNVFVLSRGLGFSAAHELSLKIKETCGIHSEAFSTAEVKHGPREIVDQKFTIIALALPASGEQEIIQTASELRDQGARVVLVAEKKHKPDIELIADTDHRLSPIHALQTLYPWIAQSSVALGRNPDKPKQLKSKVIHTI